VRVHHDTKAAEMARDVKAKAFTVGQDVVFGEGQYDTETSKGRKLLAHELAHFVQQKKRSRSLMRRESLDDIFPSAAIKPKRPIPSIEQKRAAKAIKSMFTFDSGYISPKFSESNRSLVEKGRNMISPGSSLAKKMAAGATVAYTRTRTTGETDTFTEKKSVTVTADIKKIPILVTWELYSKLNIKNYDSKDETTRLLAAALDEFWSFRGSSSNLGFTWVPEFPELTDRLKSLGFDAITSKDLIPRAVVFINQNALIQPGPYRELPESEKRKRSIDFIVAHELIHGIGYTDEWIHPFLKIFGLIPN